MIRDALSLLRATLPPDIAIEADLAASLPSIPANLTQMHQVILNLCINAAQAIGDQPGTITVRLLRRPIRAADADPREDAAPCEHLQIEIGDTGHGLKPEVMPRLFEPFFTTKADSGGTGLGLTVARRIVHEHGGWITAANNPAGGALFTVCLPVAENAATEPAPAASHLSQGRGERILLVDDEPTLAQSLRLLLERLGYRVFAYENPSQALSAFWLAPDDFDLVITDMEMPEIGGLALGEKILSLRPKLPVILMSGFAAPASDEELRRSGIQRVIPKPVTLSSLGDVIARSLGHAKKSAGKKEPPKRK